MRLPYLTPLALIERDSLLGGNRHIIQALTICPHLLHEEVFNAIIHGQIQAPRQGSTKGVCIEVYHSEKLQAEEAQKSNKST